MALAMPSATSRIRVLISWRVFFAEDAEGAAKGGGLWDDVAGAAGFQLTNSDDDQVQGIDIAADDGLQGEDHLRAADDGVGGLMGHGTMAALASDRLSQIGPAPDMVGPETTLTVPTSRSFHKWMPSGVIGRG